MNLFFEETKPNAFQKYHIPTATTKFSRKSLDISKILTFSILTQKFGTIKRNYKLLKSPPPTKGFYSCTKQVALEGTFFPARFLNERP